MPNGVQYSSDEDVVVPRICDLPHVLPGLTGKIELVFEGEQEGSVKVSKALVGQGGAGDVQAIFPRSAPQANARTGRRRPGKADRHAEDPEYGKIIQWFEAGNAIEIADDMTLAAYAKELDKVRGLRELTRQHMQKLDEQLRAPVGHGVRARRAPQNSKIAKDEMDHTDLRTRILWEASSRGRERCTRTTEHAIPVFTVAPRVATDEQRLQQLVSLFSYLVVQTSGDVEEALEWLKQLAEEYGLFDENMSMDDLIDKLREMGLIEEVKTGMQLTAKGIQRITAGCAARDIHLPQESPDGNT